MPERPPNEPPRGSSPSSEGEASKEQAKDISAQAIDLLDFEFVEVLAVPRRSRSCLACS